MNSKRQDYTCFWTGLNMTVRKYRWKETGLHGLQRRQWLERCRQTGDSTAKWEAGREEMTLREWFEGWSGPHSQQLGGTTTEMAPISRWWLVVELLQWTLGSCSPCCGKSRQNCCGLFLQASISSDQYFVNFAWNRRRWLANCSRHEDRASYANSSIFPFEPTCSSLHLATFAVVPTSRTTFRDTLHRERCMLVQQGGQRRVVADKSGAELLSGNAVTSSDR